jgi:ferredoxin
VAIVADTEPGLDKWLKLNADYAKVWPNITIKRDPPPDAKDWDGVPEKYQKFFSTEPGQGD